MTIREMVSAAQSNCVKVPRLDFMALLSKAKTSDPVEAVVVADLTMGCKNAPVEFVMIETKQAQLVCDLAERKQESAE